MTIRRRMKQTGSLGDAIDARRRTEQALEQRDTLGGSAAAPLSSGGSTAGGGGVTNDPALPESFVTGLAGGSGNPMLDGEITITGSGAATVTQDELASEIDVHSPDYTAGDGLSLASEEFAVDSTVVRTSGNQAIAGLKTFSTAPQTPATPTNDNDLTNKDYVDERTKVVHRQVFPAAGSRDSVSGNNEINLPWVIKEYPTGSSPASLSIQTNSDPTFDTSLGPCIILDNALILSWTSTQITGSIVSGLQLCISLSARQVGNTAILRAHMKVVDTDRLDSIYLAINDMGGSLVASSTNLIGTLTDDTWTIISSGDLSLGSGVDNLFITLTIQGTSSATNVGNTNVHLEWLEVVQLE